MGKKHSLHIMNRLWWGLLSVLSIFAVIGLYGVVRENSPKPQRHRMDVQTEKEEKIAKGVGHQALKNMPKAKRGAKQGARYVQNNKKVAQTKKAIQNRMKK